MTIWTIAMHEKTISKVPVTWLGLPVIATVARILCHELTLQNEYLRLENKILMSKIQGRVHFRDDERRSLAGAALAMGGKLMEAVVNIVKPANILAWQRRIKREKWDYSARRKRPPGRPKTAGNIEALVFVLHLQTRRMLLARATFSPNGQWLKQQVRHVLWVCEEQGVDARFFLCDNDRYYADDFDTLLRGSGVAPIHTPYAAPNANAFAERWIRSLRQECLDHLVIFGLTRLQRVVDEYRLFYNGHRPHHSFSNRVPDRSLLPSGLLLPASESGLYSGDIRCEHSLGGLLKSYFRRAA